MIRPSRFFLAGFAAVLLSACAQEGPSDKTPEPAEQEQKLSPQAPPTSEQAPTPQAKDDFRKGPHRGPAFLFRAALDELELRPDQKTTIEGLIGDLERTKPWDSPARRDFHKALATGIRAGKLDTAALAPHYAAIEKEATETSQKIHAALEKLHRTLTAEQRQKLVASLEQRMAKGPGGPGAGMCGHGPGGCQAGCGACGGGPDMDDTADDDEAAPPARGHGRMGKGRHGGMGMGMGMGPGFGPMADLDLTDAQKEKLRALRPEMKGERAAKPDMQKKGEHMKEMLAAFAKDGFDANQLKPPVDPGQRAREHAEARAKHLGALIGILEPAQREKLAARVESGPMGPNGKMGPMGRHKH